MNKNLFLLFILVNNFIFSQAPNFDWALNPEHPVLPGGHVYGTSNAVDSSGNVYVAGFFSRVADFDPSTEEALLSSGSGGNGIFIAKYDSLGNYLWAKNIGSTAAIGTTYSIGLDANNNIYLTGEFIGTGDFDPSEGIANLTSDYKDLFIAKYDSLGNYLWAETIITGQDDFLSGLGVDSNGDLLITGRFEGVVDFDPSIGTANLEATMNKDIFLAKYDAYGNYVWAKNIDGNNYYLLNSSPISLAIDNSDNILLTGDFISTIDMDPSAGIANLSSDINNDVFIAKYDPSGNYVWAKNMGGTIGEVWSYKIALDPDDNIHLAGRYKDTVDFDPSYITENLITSNASGDAFIAKYDVSGNYVWAKSISGGNTEKCRGLAIDDSGNMYITGNFGATVDFDPSIGVANLNSQDGRIFLAKYDPLGNYVWAKNISGSNVSQSSWGIVLDKSGHVHITGHFIDVGDFDPSPTINNLTAGSPYINAFVAKYDASGNYVFANVLGALDYDLSYEEGQGIVVDSDGSTYVTGNFKGTVDFDPSTGTANLVSSGSNDIFIAKYDASGNYIWAKNIGGIDDDFGYSIAIDNNGDLIIAGNFKDTVDFDPSGGLSYMTATNSDVFLAKYDASGNFIWANNIIGSSVVDVGNIVLDTNDNIHIIGSFRETADFDPSVGQALLFSEGSNDVFFAKFDNSGNYIWAKSIGAWDNDLGYDIDLDTNGNVYITGSFRGTVDFDPSIEVVSITSSGGDDSFIAKYDASGNYLWATGLEVTAHDRGQGIAVDKGGNVHVTGYLGGGWSNDVYIVKFDDSGNYLWGESMWGTGDNRSYDISLDSNGHLYITGSFQSAIDFDSSGDEGDHSSLGASD
ncbi:MAG: hypothetical protein JKY09_01000, partial [Crocinitomicaceae bacterium]|nr:hypothetical protein [Crocinitomicaceae bacterium]